MNYNTEEKQEEEQSATLYLIRGLPGSGKTSFAKALHIKYVEADHYFEEIGRYQQSLLSAAHDDCYRKAKAALKDGSDVVVSNSSTSEWEVARYATLAEEMEVRLVSLIVENRHAGKSIHDVPKEAIEIMRQGFSIKL